MNYYVCYFDTTGFEWIFNVSSYEKKKVLAYLKGEKKIEIPIPKYAILRAQANPQRFPEIWGFESDLTQQELETVADASPQVLVDAVRQCGRNLYRTHREEQRIV